MSGQSGDAFKYLMGQAPASKAAPAPASASAASTGATGFLKGITGIAGPDGIYDVNTGGTTPWSASNPKPAGGGFFGGTSGGTSGGNTSPTFSFDPITGAFTRLAPNTPDTPAAALPDAAYANIYSVDGANGGLMSLAQGGQTQYNLGGYSDGGRLLKGPGDGVSDSIPATIGNRQPARLADGEFVVPARIVSELGNGSTEAGARKLYAMMDRVQKARKKSIGKNRVAVNSKTEKMLPA
jgi:hypothetical protein